MLQQLLIKISGHWNTSSVTNMSVCLAQLELLIKTLADGTLQK